MSRRSDYRDTAHGVGLGFVAIALALVGVLILGAMWAFGFGLFSAGTAEVRGETGVRERTVADGNYRIAAYDRFFDLCAAVQAKEDAITALEAQQADATGTSKARITDNLLALTTSRASLIRKYNADAAKEGTRGQFRASSLPYTLDPNRETTCA